MATPSQPGWRSPGRTPQPPPPGLDDSTTELIVRAKGGETAAAEVLYGRYLPRMLRWATGRLPGCARGAMDTGDVVQATLLRTLRRLATFEPRHAGAFPAYLRRSMLNLIRDEVRKLGCRPESAPLSGEEVTPLPSPLEDAVGQELVDRYDAAIQQLSETDQALLFLKVELGFGFEDIAVVLDRPSADAARMATRRALLRLARGMDRGDG